MANLSIENLGFHHLSNSEINKVTDSSDHLRIQKESSSQSGVNESTGADGTSFTDVLKKSIDQVNEYQKSADTAIKSMVAGKSKNIHETMLAIEKADMSLKLMMQVRNKVLDAYKEIMRMQV